MPDDEFDFNELRASPAPVPAQLERLAPMDHALIPIASENLIALWREAARSDIATILLPQAVRTLGVIMRDAQAPASARVAAARAVFAVALPDQVASATKKALHEMSASEIESALYALRDEIRDRELTLLT